MSLRDGVRVGVCDAGVDGQLRADSIGLGRPRELVQLVEQAVDEGQPFRDRVGVATPGREDRGDRPDRQHRLARRTERGRRIGRYLLRNRVLLDRLRLDAVRLEDHGALGWREIVRQVVDGAPVQLEGLAVRRQASRVTGPGQGRLERPPAQAGTLVSAATNGSRTGPPVARRTRRHGRGIAGDRRPGRSDRSRRAAAGGGSRAGPAYLGGSRTKLSISSWSGASIASGATSMIPARTSRDEAAPDDRRRPGRRPGPPGERCDSRARTASSIVSGTVASRIAKPFAVASASSAPSSSSMWSGMPSVRSVDRVDHPARSRQPGVEDQRGHQRRVGLGQRHQPDLLGDPLGQQTRAPIAKARPGRRLVGAIAAAQEELAVTRPTRQLADQLEAQVVRPLEVVEARGASDRGPRPGCGRRRP